jgi:hypothetical protein
MQVLPCYIFAGAPAVAMHCHLPFGIFSQVSTQRSWALIALPLPSVLCLATHRQRSPCSQTWSPLRSPMSLTCQLLPLTIVSNGALPCMVPRRRLVPGWCAGRGRGFCARCRSRREFALASLRFETISSRAPDLFAIPTSGASLVAVTIITDSREE